MKISQGYALSYMSYKMFVLKKTAQLNKREKVNVNNINLNDYLVN